MCAQCQHLDGRVVIRGRDGAPEQLRRGLLGVAVFVVGVVAVPVLALAGPAAFLVLLSGGPVVVDTGAVVPADPVAAARLLVPLVPLVAVYAVGALGYVIRWRREYDVTVEVREGLLRWD